MGGILFKGRLYFKTSLATAGPYKEAGMKPFRPSAKMTLKSCYEVPPEILDDAGELVAWAKRSLSASTVFVWKTKGNRDMNKLSKEEERLRISVEKREWKPVSPRDSALRQYAVSARRTLRKNRRKGN